jgi:hypothetical protein
MHFVTYLYYTRRFLRTKQWVVFMLYIDNISLYYCGKNCWVMETSKHAHNNRITSIYSSLLGDGQCANELRGSHVTCPRRDISDTTIGTTWVVFCAVGANQQYNWVFCVWSHGGYITWLWNIQDSSVSKQVQFQIMRHECSDSCSSVTSE